jgi:signal peptidase I
MEPSPSAAPAPAPAQPAGPARPSRRNRWLREGVSIAGFALALFAARSTLADHYYVPTGSMIPSVSIGDRLIVNKLAYSLRVPFSDVVVIRRNQPQRGDVVVLKSPENGITLLKRVAAVPGDEVAVTDGRLSINGQPVPISREGDSLVERLGRSAHPVRLTAGGGPDFGPVRLEIDQYLMLGDNRGESHDGRSFGLVEGKAILGKALGVWMRDGHPGWHSL